MRYLLNAISPTQLKSPNSSSIVYQTISAYTAKMLFESLKRVGVCALNPQSSAFIFEKWGSDFATERQEVLIDVGDDALLILPKAENPKSLFEYEYMWCGVLSNSTSSESSTPTHKVYEFAGGDIGSPWFRDIEHIPPTTLVEASFGCEWECSGLALYHSAPIVVYRGVLG